MSNGIPPAEEPTIVHDEGSFSDYKIVHPSFGQINASRVSVGGAGRGISLYGTDFDHNSFIEVSIQTSELHRSLSHDRPHPRKQVVKIAMSEAQWATFVSSMNIGSGVQCTLRFVTGQGHIPSIKDQKKTADKFKIEMGDHLAGILEEVIAVQNAVDELNLTKGKLDPIKSALAKIRQDIKSNLPFIEESFDRHVEEIVEKSKVEIHGYMTGLLQQIGIDAINAPLSIVDANESNEEP